MAYRSLLSRFFIAITTIILVFVIKTPVEALFGSGPPLIFFVPAVTFSAWYGGLWPGLTATLLSSIICIFFYFPPVDSVLVGVPNDRVRLSLFVMEGVLTSVLMERVHTARRRSDQEVAERLRAEAEVRKERDFAERLIGAAQAVVLVLDCDGRVVRFNPFLERVTGWLPHAVQGADWFAFVSERDRPRAREAFSRTLARGETALVVHPLGVRGGPEREIEWSYRLMAAVAGEEPGVLAIGHDITDLKDAQSRAVQSERLAAIGQMVAGLAHESRNALQRGQACLEMLALRLNDHPEALDLVTGVQQAIDDLHHLYEEVRSYAAPINLHRRVCRLSELLREAWSRTDTLRKGRDAQIAERGEPDLTCEGDPFRLVQVFRNILDNSLAACHDPVQIDVEWVRTELDGQPAVRIAVRDNGPGLSPDQRRHLFDPFYTTKTQGTGLGMPIARRIVEAHGGLISSAEPNGRSGAIIQIVLPRGDV